jgi:hypothetical protein
MRYHHGTRRFSAEGACERRNKVKEKKKKGFLRGTEARKPSEPRQDPGELLGCGPWEFQRKKVCFLPEFSL